MPTSSCRLFPVRLELRRTGNAAVVGALAVAAALLLPPCLSGQPGPQELRAEACPTCRITERVVATLGRPNDSVQVTYWSRVVRLGGRRYLVGPVSVPGQLAIYQSDGTLERVIALEGSGPADHQTHVGPMFESWSGGAVVVDRKNGRLTLIDTLGRTSTYANLRGSLFFGASLPDGRLVINAESPPGDPLGRPLHVIDRTHVVRSFGPAAGRLGPISEPAVRLITPSRDGRLWVSPNNVYELSLIDSLGRAATTLTRPFPTAPVGASGELRQFVSSIREDSTGRVWVLLARRDRAPDAKAHQRVTTEALRALAASLTSSLDIVDPKRGVVLYSQPLDGPPRQLIGDGLTYSHREEANGAMHIDVVSLRFVTDPR